MRAMTLSLSLLILSLHALAAQDSNKEHAEALWKNSVRKSQGKLSQTQTDHAFIMGTVDVKTLESIGKATQRSVVYAQKSVGYDKAMVKRPNQQMRDKPQTWEGKLLVFVCKERHEFVDLFVKLKQAKPDANEVCTYAHDVSRTYVLMGPALNSRKLNYEVMAVELAGAATLTRRHDPLPRWFSAAYGRMLAYKFDSKGFAAERANIPLWASKYHVRDLQTDSNPAIEPAILLPLQASLLETLAQSSTFQDKWFEILDETAFRGGNLDAALRELKFTQESAQIAWKNSLWK